MANVDAFLKALQDFDKDNTPVVACEWVEKNLFTQEKFNPEAMKSKSAAAAGMCAWVINIVKYYRIYEVVEPKRQLLAEANVKLDEANTKLAQVCTMPRVYTPNLSIFIYMIFFNSLNPEP